MTVERIDWVSGQPHAAVEAYLKWRDAVEAVDKSHDRDTIALSRLLRSDVVIGPDARTLIADLLERHRLKRKPGKQATPAYRLTPVEAEISRAKSLYRYFRRRNSEAKALDCALDELGKTEERDREAMISAIKGWRGSTNRMQNRRR